MNEYNKNNERNQFGQANVTQLDKDKILAREQNFLRALDIVKETDIDKRP